MPGKPENVLIVGVNGQDGTLLKNSLEAQGIAVTGISRSGIEPDVELPSLNGNNFQLTNAVHVTELLQAIAPDEIYYLAAHHTSSEFGKHAISAEEYNNFHNVHVAGLINFLSAMDQKSRLFYAASSLLYDGSIGPEQCEETPFSPVGFYGLTKMQGKCLCNEFRKHNNIFAASGILYNHESALRASHFLSKRLIVAAHQISLGNKNELILGNLDAKTDWGYAPDYVEAFQMILRHNEPDDFIIATGESHTVREFSEIVFEYFGLNSQKYVREDKTLLHRNHPQKIGNFKKLNAATGWKPKQDFPTMVRNLVDDYLELIGEGKAK